jgi:Flp pilus assembly protein CpaB
MADGGERRELGRQSAMVMTRPDEGLAPTDLQGPPAARVVARVPGIPGARAVVGGLLVAAAGVGTFVSWQRTSGTPDHSYAIAARDLAPGERVTADAVRFVPVDLPGAIAGAAFDSPADLEGRVLVAPVGDGQLLQLGAVSDQVGGEPAAEVSITLTRDLAVDGRLAPGDTVDVYATDDATTVAAAGLRVVAITEAGGSFGDGRELTVTLALTDQDDGAPIIQAAREGQVTLVRTTHAPPRATTSDRGPSAGATDPTSGPDPTPAPDPTTGPADPAAGDGAAEGEG